MLGIETQEGFGLGNQLFFYVTTRCIALSRGYAFSVLDPEHFANNMHSDCGLYFMDLDMGVPSSREDYEKVYHEKESRLFAGNSKHDLTHGVYVAFTSDTVQYILAPKYWARHNVSDGYWASEQNIYEGWHYMDRRGRVFSAQECREKLAQYKKTSSKYARLNEKPTGLRLSCMKLRGWYIYKRAYLEKIGRGVMRRFWHLLGKR